MAPFALNRAGNFAAEGIDPLNRLKRMLASAIQPDFTGSSH
jgi:hypothetical protein